MSQPSRCYSATIAWSVRDGEYIALSPEWPGLSGIDADPANAIHTLYEAIEMAVEVYAEDKRDLPTPQYFVEAR